MRAIINYDLIILFDKFSKKYIFFRQILLKLLRQLNEKKKHFPEQSIEREKPKNNRRLVLKLSRKTSTIEKPVCNGQSCTAPCCAELQKPGVKFRLFCRSCGVRTPFKVSLDTQNAFWKPYRKRCQSRTMRNLKKSKALTAEDCDSVWITDTVLDQPLAVSEQLENNDPMRFSAKEKHVAAQQSVKDIESYQTMQEEKIPMDEILKNSPYSSGDEKNDDSCEISKVAHEEELFRCVECGKCFKLKDSFHRHMRIHKDERPFTCHICGKQFRDSGGLTRHLKDVHAKLKNFMCDLCGRSFASKATREDHRRTHTGERPYVCDSCGKTFKSKASLYIHSKLHTDEFPHACSYCGKQFRRRQEVLAHVTTHTGEKNHTCEICGKKFRVKSELARHKLIHSEDKPFVCGKCGLAFRQKRYLNNHIKSRHSESS